MFLCFVCYKKYQISATYKTKLCWTLVNDNMRDEQTTRSTSGLAEMTSETPGPLHLLTSSCSKDCTEDFALSLSVCLTSHSSSSDKNGHMITHKTSDTCNKWNASAIRQPVAGFLFSIFSLRLLPLAMFTEWLNA